jgi:mannose-6-phosphate isomerase-like protein (cupin superfamily)
MTNRQSGKVDKGWGYEIIWATTDEYCGKLLVFDRAGAKFSMHFHKDKDESWFVNAGSFKLTVMNLEDGSMHEQTLREGDIWRNPPMVPHQLEALVPNSVIFEVSTPDSIEDNYRIFPGDSQNQNDKDGD